jgi:aspartyl-tRNA(Asn)/glutamyl-tRNA(Gln) amidotransferase subunit A
VTIYRSFAAVQADLKTGAVTCRQLVDHYLDRIQERQNLNVFTEVYADEARQRADELDQKAANGQPLGKLFGMVIGLKDVFWRDLQPSLQQRLCNGY